LNSDYTQLTIALAAEDIDVVAAIAHMVAPYGFYVEDYSQLEKEIDAIAHTNLIDEELLAKDRSSGAVHLFISKEENPAEAVAFLRERLDAAGIAYTMANTECRAGDWENNWKQYFRPMPVGERLMIIPDWLKAETPQTKGRVPLYLDPGLAFGTGSHATTRLCLALLEKNMPPTGRVLDIGCGSGILGIAALRLSDRQGRTEDVRCNDTAQNTFFGNTDPIQSNALHVFGVDIDPVAVRAAMENAVLNGLAPPVYTVAQGILSEQPNTQFALVLANIVADVLIPLAPEMPPRLCEGGRVILSGIIEHREAEVTAAYKAQGLHVIERSEDEGWVALVLGR
jgi:ribosomal protein L11 methyltransferase